MNHLPMRVAASLLMAGALVACASPPQAAPPPVSASTSSLAKLPSRSLEKRTEPLVRHVLHGKVYYFLRSPCCDLANHLYDEHGNYVCAPSGGFSGRGDGKCPALREALTHSEGEQVPNPFYKP
jgi:hypothetical protein